MNKIIDLIIKTTLVTFKIGVVLFTGLFMYKTYPVIIKDITAGEYNLAVFGVLLNVLLIITTILMQWLKDE